jgi:Tol biopolymer transport system component
MNRIPRPGPLGIASLLILAILITGVQAVGYTSFPSISSDGRFVAFGTVASLVPGDTNDYYDIFLRDRTGNTTTLLSKSTGGVPGNDESIHPSLSADGHYVAFFSLSNNLVYGDTNGEYDIFVRDRKMGTTTRISKSSKGLQGNGGSYDPEISANGRFVAYESGASNLIAGDTNAASDIFVRDLPNRTTTRVSKSTAGVQGNDSSSNPSLSGDGRYVAFDSSADNLVAGDSNGARDVFLRDRETARTMVISKSLAGSPGNGYSSSPSVSGDGRYVAFASEATNLVAGDTNGVRDIFVRDRQNGTTYRISKNTIGRPGNRDSFDPAITPDGRYVVFTSAATNLVAGDTNGVDDVFLHDRQTARTYQISKNQTASPGNEASSMPVITPDGRFVAFVSSATNLARGDSAEKSAVFVRDRRTGTTYLVSKS